MRLQRLDISSLDQAYQWTAGPQWFAEMSDTDSKSEFVGYLNRGVPQGNLFIGVFNPDFDGLFVLSERRPGRFETHIFAKRDIGFQTLAEVGLLLRDQLFDHGATEIGAYVATRNRPILELAEIMGMTRTGEEILRGSYRGRLIRWAKVKVNGQQKDNHFDYATSAVQ